MLLCKWCQIHQTMWKKENSYKNKAAPKRDTDSKHQINIVRLITLLPWKACFIVWLSLLPVALLHSGAYCHRWCNTFCILNVSNIWPPLWVIITLLLNCFLYQDSMSPAQPKPHNRKGWHSCTETYDWRDCALHNSNSQYKKLTAKYLMRSFIGILSSQALLMLLLLPSLSQKLTHMGTR